MDQRILQIIQKHPELKSEFEEIYPELKESEDERIRNLIYCLIRDRSDNQKLLEHNGISVDKALAYLENQKEQKSLNIGAASEWLRKHVCRYINSEYNEFHKCVEYDGSIDKERLINDFEEAMQKEEKPECDNETEVQKAYREGKNAGRKEVFDHPEYYGLQLRRKYDYETGEMNPEWSEEDDAVFGDLMWCIEQAKKFAKDENDMGNIWFAENWLKKRIKFLRPCQPCEVDDNDKEMEERMIENYMEGRES